MSVSNLSDSQIEALTEDEINKLDPQAQVEIFSRLDTIRQRRRTLSETATESQAKANAAVRSSYHKKVGNDGRSPDEIISTLVGSLEDLAIQNKSSSEILLSLVKSQEVTNSQINSICQTNSSSDPNQSKYILFNHKTFSSLFYKANSTTENLASFSNWEQSIRNTCAALDIPNATNDIKRVIHGILGCQTGQTASSFSTLDIPNIANLDEFFFKTRNIICSSGCKAIALSSFQKCTLV